MTDANAAQIASRKIREARGFKGKLGSRNTSNTGGSGFSAAPTFTSQQASSSGGLFGGGLNVSGTFNFSAPVQGISFGGNSGTSTPPFGSDTEQDRRADTTGEEAARRNKPFQMVDGSATLGPQPFSSTFQRTPLSPLGQPNGVGAVSDLVKSNPFQIGRSPSPLPSSTFNFGSTATQQQPASNIFGFGQNSNAVPGTTSFRFGTPPPVQDKPANNIFSFGQNTSQPPPETTGISFGSTTAAEKPTGSIFSFGQTPSQPQPSSSTITFSSTPASVQPISNLFGQSTAPASTPESNPFGPSSQQPTTSTNFFSNLKPQTTPATSIFGNQTQQSTAPTKPLFGELVQKSAPTTSLFGGQGQQSAPTTNIFGNVGQASALPNNFFGAQNDQSVPSSNILETSKSSSSIFGAQQSGTTPNIFADKTPATTTTSIFGTQTPQSSTPTNLFGHLNQPTPQVSNGSMSETVNSTTAGSSQNVNGEWGNSTTIGSATTLGSGPVNIDKTPKIPSSPKPAPATLNFPASAQPTTSNSSFEGSPFGNEFGASKEPVSILPSIEVEGSVVNNNLFSSLQAEKSAQPATGNLFSSMKPIEVPEDASQPAPSGMFPSLSQSTSAQSETTNIFAKANASRPFSSPSKSSANQPTALVNGTSASESSKIAELQNYFSEMGEVPDSVIESKCPAHFSDAQKIQFYAAYRVRSLNKGIKQYIDASPIGADFSPAFYHYVARRDEILEACSTGLNNLKRKLGETDDQQSSQNKRSKPSESTVVDQHAPRTSSPLKTQAVVNNDDSGRPRSPEKKSNARTLQPANTSPTKAQQSINGSTTPKAPPPSAPLLSSQQLATPPSPSPSSKRKAEVQITKDHPTEEEFEGRNGKLPKLNGGITGSATSNIFKDIIDKPSQTTPKSPEKKMFSIAKTNSSDDQPRVNPFANLPMPSGSPFAMSAAAKPSAAGSTATANIFASKVGTQASSLFAPETGDSMSNSTSAANSAASPAKPNPFAPNPNTQSSSIFGGRPASTSTSTSNAAASNPFAPKEGNAASSLFSSKLATPSIFAAKPASNAAPSDLPASDLDSKTTDLASKSVAKDNVVKDNVIKPPTFGSAPVNFLAQFQKSASDSEAEAMKKAKEEDMDSDEDESEWEVRYKEKREAQKKATEELAKTKRAAFVPGKGFTFGQAENALGTAQSAPKPFFAQTKTPSNSNTSLFVPAVTSRASSPGAASSRASSIFDGVGSSKPVSLGSNNIFGHLSDVDSGAESGHANDADDDGTDEESTESNEEQDDENKDSTYDPSSEQATGSGTPGTPGTPVEETGPGIASTKKPTNPLTFGASSGTATPGGSLFDRISKDSNGNPIRQIPSENKENAGPSGPKIFGSDGTNLFSKLGRTSARDTTKSPQDNTWKQDSPIKFGASTSPPSVSITAPTPTKTSPFASLFGSTAPKSSTPTPSGIPFSGLFGSTSTPKPSSPAPTSTGPFAGLFGSNTAPKPTSSPFSNLSNTENKPASVGFPFGAPSTTTSSLFPSAAGSTTTSRATTPGGTTDGESTNEANGDPDAEHHEQIDLTSGGPGEENEEVLHQVRAKALKFEPSKDGGGKNDWVVKGLGPLRVLKNKETGSSRILLRADPSGTIVLNRGILANVSYEAAGKTLKLLTAGEGGKGLETWLLQVKTPAGADELAGVLEANKVKA